MTFLNNGFNKYKVVKHSKNIWDGYEEDQVIFETNNLLSAYTKLLQQEEYYKPNPHDAGSPLEVTFRIDIYQNEDSK